MEPVTCRRQRGLPPAQGKQLGTSRDPDAAWPHAPAHTLGSLLAVRMPLAQPPNHRTPRCRLGKTCLNYKAVMQDTDDDLTSARPAQPCLGGPRWRHVPAGSGATLAFYK